MPGLDREAIYILVASIAERFGTGKQKEFKRLKSQLAKSDPVEAFEGLPCREALVT